MSKKTPWYPGTTKPVRVGLYQRDLSSYYRQGGRWSWWNGQQWCGWGGTPQIAVANGTLGNVSSVQDAPWRGITRAASTSKHT